MIFSAISGVRSIRARIAWCTRSSTSAPMMSRRFLSTWRSCSKWCRSIRSPTPAGRRTADQGSSEAPCDVVLRQFLLRLGEHVGRATVLHQAAEPEEGSAIRDPGRLLQVVGHDHDRVALLQAVDQLLDLEGGDRVERGAGLV